MYSFGKRYSIDNLPKNNSQKIVRPRNENVDLDSKVKHIICEVLKREKEFLVNGKEYAFR